MVVQTGQRSPKILKQLYIASMLLLLLSFPYMMVTYTHFDTYHIPLPVWLLRCFSTVLALYLGKLWKNTGWKLLSVYLLYIFLRVFLCNPGDIFTDRFSESLLTGVWAFTACYGLAGILTPKERKLFLRTGAALWTLAITASCCVGIYAAWRGQRLYTAGEAAFWGLYPVRLMIPYLPTVSGALASLSAMIALCALVMEQKKPVKAFYGFSLIPMLLALALTDSRTAFLSFAAGAAVLILICLLRRNIPENRNIAEKQRTTGKSGVTTKKTLFALAACLLVFAGAVFLLIQAENAFHALRQRGGLLVSTALAETVETTSVARGFSGDSSMLTGRFELWKGTVRYLFENPLILFFGAGKADPMQGINAFLHADMAHTHNLPMMLLVESGIIGLLPLLAFIIHVIRQGVRTLKQSKGLFPAILLSVLVTIFLGDLAECFAWMASDYFPALPLLFLLLGVFCFRSPEAE